MRAPSVARFARSGTVLANLFTRARGAFGSGAGGFKRFCIGPLGRVGMGAALGCPVPTGRGLMLGHLHRVDRLGEVP